MPVLVGREVYQATPYDPVVLTSVAITMVTEGLVSTLIPARRESGSDVGSAIRVEKAKMYSQGQPILWGVQRIIHQWLP